MAMFDPPHPGEIIKEDCLKPLNLTVTRAAEGLGVSRQTLSKLLNGRAGLSATMAIRLEKAGWSTAETWLGVQSAHDLWQAKQQIDSIKVDDRLAFGGDGSENLGEEAAEERASY